eukprot:TRINITY_DN8346_c0_g1_i1.p2 TRINITY_DN8346_c0_g1~~TRINITY_DN8346_c0_g1_i1.p2  ORF type:complete len:222 (+),score=71.01 TRINITY_DN8346_c0_g1_i1:170-835(+)
MKQTKLNFFKKGLAVEETKKQAEKRPLDTTSDQIKQEAKRLKKAPSDPNTDTVLESAARRSVKKNKGPPEHSVVDKQFHPIEDAPFDLNEPVPFSFIAASLADIEKCKGGKSKDAIKEIISNVLRSVSLLHPEELASVFYFYIVKLAPDYKSKETGVGQEILVRAVAQVVGRSEKEVRESKVSLGDLGLVFAESKNTMKTMDNFFTKKKIRKVTVSLAQDQ